MKQIQPVSIWYNGQMIAATIFNMISTNDNLVDSATFYYALFVNANFQVADGVLTMSGFDYEAYTTSPDSNSYAYQWGATQLNLTLV
jgi:hypothetical protein